MPTKPIERLMFAQGNNCFFCERPLPRSEASVEHLVAVANGGADNDENCVACCKSLNGLFGRMSLKEKLQIVLRQRGAFKCPASTHAAPPQPIEASKTTSVPNTPEGWLALVITDLQKRGNARPGTVDKLLNTIRTRLGDQRAHAESVMSDLSSQSLISISDNKVKYSLQAKRG